MYPLIISRQKKINGILSLSPAIILSLQSDKGFFCNGCQRQYRPDDA